MWVTWTPGCRCETSAKSPKSAMTAVLDDEQAVGDEAGGVLLAADVLPRIVDEVEERAADADGAHDRAVSCR